MRGERSRWPEQSRRIQQPAAASRASAAVIEQRLQWLRYQGGYTILRDGIHADVRCAPAAEPRLVYRPHDFTKARLIGPVDLARSMQ